LRVVRKAHPLNPLPSGKRKFIKKVFQEGFASFAPLEDRLLLNVPVFYKGKD
jgi:hypothetical protein